MWRKWCISLGEFFLGDFFRNAMLAIFAAGSGLTVIADVISSVSYDPKPPFYTALEATITSLWLLLFFLVTYWLFQRFGKVLVWLGGYYPVWFYFPKIAVTCDITPKQEIELRIIKKRWQRISMQAEFSRLDSSVERLPSPADGISPSSNRELLPLVQMTGRDARIKTIGRLLDGGMALSAGDKNGDMELTKPGLYDYFVNLSGDFRKHHFGGHAQISIRITEKHEVRVEAQDD